MVDLAELPMMFRTLKSFHLHPCYLDFSTIQSLKMGEYVCHHLCDITYFYFFGILQTFEYFDSWWYGTMFSIDLK